MTTEDEDRIDPAIVEQLYDQHAADLRHFLLGVLRQPGLVDEVLQATFTKALEVGHTSREVSRRGWLFRVAFNEAMLIRRRAKVHDKSIQQLARRQSDDSETPHDRLTQGEVVGQVQLALETLPAEQQQIVKLRIYDELTFAAIAEQLGLPLGTVLTRMRLALKKLNQRLDRNL